MASEVNPPRPRTVREAVHWLGSALSQGTLAALRRTPEEDVIDPHVGVGADLRNRFGLHHDHPALLTDCRTLDPDAASLVILRALWRQLPLQ